MMTRSPDSDEVSSIRRPGLLRPGVRGPGVRGPGVRGRRLRRAGLLALGASAALTVATTAPGLAAAAPAVPSTFTQTNLISDIPGVAGTTDPNLVNPWGFSEDPSGPLWVSDQGTGVSTFYTGDIGGTPLTPVPVVVQIPGGVPTGQVFNGTGKFIVQDGSQSGTAVFIFAGQKGDITGWNPAVGAVGTATSMQAEEGVHVPGADFTGLAIAGDQLFAANFRDGNIDVFNSDFQRVSEPGAFRDPAIPRGFAAYNITNIGGNLFVSFARQGIARHDAVAGGGFVDVFSPDGVLLQRLIRGGGLDAPWGMVIAPSSFGTFSSDLLVANSGDGVISAFDSASGAFRGVLRNADGRPIVNRGLKGLILGDGPTVNPATPAAGTPQTVFFSAGIVAGHHGLVGSITLGS